MTLKLKSTQDVSTVIEVALRNGYKVTSRPIYEPYWNTRVDHYEVVLEEIPKKDETFCIP